MRTKKISCVEPIHEQALYNCFLYNFSYATHILHNVSTGCYWYAYSSSKIMQRCHWYGYNSFHIKIDGIMSDNIAVRYIQSDTYSQLHDCARPYYSSSTLTVSFTNTCLSVPLYLKQTVTSQSCCRWILRSELCSFSEKRATNVRSPIK